MEEWEGKTMALRSCCYRVLLLTIVVGAVAFCTTATAQAQDNPQPKVEVFGGYAFLHPGVSAAGQDLNLENVPGGWGAAATFNLFPHIGLPAVFCGHNLNFYFFVQGIGCFYVLLWTVMFGPHIELRTSHLTFFGEGLFGLHRVAAANVFGFQPDNAFGLAAGGGVDWHISRHFDIRLGQVDYVYSDHTFGPRQTFATPVDVKFNSVRYRAGVNILLGVAPPGPPPGASCSASPTDVYAGEPVTVTAHPMYFNPKRTLSYKWSGSGKLSGTGPTATIDTTGMNPGSYTAGATITDGHKGEASCRASFTI